MDRVSINHDLQCIRVWEAGDQIYFTKKRYGSMKAAYQAAVKYESNMDPKIRLGKKRPRTKPYSNSQSGIVGVNPYSEIRDGFAGWRAIWTETVNGKRVSKSKKFSFSTYNNYALEKAIQYRNEMVQKHMLRT